MQSEEEKIDLACLQAVQDMGGFVTLESWLYSLHLRDAVPTYDDFFESYCRLRKSKLIKNSVLGWNDVAYRLTLRGRAALRKKEIQYKESKKAEKYILREMTFEVAKNDALEKLNNTTDEVLKKQKWAAFLGILLWFVSVAFLVGGIVFACLYQGLIGWRIGVGVAGVVLYILLGMADSSMVASRCSYRVENFLTIVCSPSCGLLALIFLGLQGV